MEIIIGILLLRPVRKRKGFINQGSALQCVGV